MTFDESPSEGGFVVSLNNGDHALKIQLDRVMLNREDLVAVAGELRRLADWLEAQEQVFDT